MLYFLKSQPEPDCLKVEKTKASGDYKCGCILDRIKADFHNKCYICEDSQPHTINVEHFRPHKGNIDLKFSWDNLFWSCAHCNNIKLDNYENILDCTNEQEDIEVKVHYEFKPFPFEIVNITPLDGSPGAQSTAELVANAFNGTTKLKAIESANLRNKLLEEMHEFQGFLIEYFKPTCDDEDKDYYRRKIKSHLHVASNFTSFKRWAIRDNPTLNKEFSQYLVGT